MTPLTLPTQITLESRVTAGPGVPVWTYNDYWGTFVSVFDLPEPHDDLVIRAVATVETEPFGGIPAAADRPSWAELRRAGAAGRLLEFLLPTALTTVAEEISGAAIAEISAGLSPDAGRRGHLRPRPRARHLHARRDRRAHQRPGGVGQGPGRLPGHGAARGLPDARRRPPGQVRLRLPAPRPEGRAGQHRRSASRTPGSSTGRARGRRSTRRAAPRSASATSSSPAAATTATSRRSRASTTARPTATCGSRSR